jgi:hypothetical protein
MLASRLRSFDHGVDHALGAVDQLAESIHDAGPNLAFYGVRVAFER